MAGLQYIGFLLTVHTRSLSLLQIDALESPDIGLNFPDNWLRLDKDSSVLHSDI